MVDNASVIATDLVCYPKIVILRRLSYLVQAVSLDPEVTASCPKYSLRYCLAELMN